MVAVDGGIVPSPPGPERRLVLPWPPLRARAGAARSPECACAAPGGWFERGGAAMAGPGPDHGRSAQGLQRRGPPGPAGVRLGRGGRPAGRGHGKSHLLLAASLKRLEEMEGGGPVRSLGVRCERRAVAFLGNARQKWALNRLEEVTCSCYSCP